MGLIDLKTDFKSLKYDSMPLGSDAPYVTKDIDNPPSSNRFSMQITKRVDDLSRIAQMFINKPGLKYLASEALLQQQSNIDKISKASNKGKAVLDAVKSTIVGTDSILRSTLAQVPVAGTGLHFLKGFRTDTYLSPGSTNAFTGFFGAGGVEGAQYALRGEEVPGERESDLKIRFEDPQRPSKFQYDAKASTKDIEIWETKDNRPLAEQNTFEKYESNKSKAKGGKVIGIETSEPAIGTNADTGEISTFPNLPQASRSVGVETTATKGLRTSQNLIQSISHTGSIAGDVFPESSTNKVTSQNSYYNPYTRNTEVDSINNAQTGKPIRVASTDSPETTVTKGELPGTKPTDTSGEFPQVSANKAIRDFRKGAKNAAASYVRKSGIKYGSQNMESRIHLGKQGKDRSGDDYRAKDDETTDKVNELPIGYKRQDASKEAIDLAKFFFEIITPDDSSRGHGNFIHFRAYIESIDDNYTADWQTHKYVGRAENFQTYGGFDRDISVSFKIAAMTRQELKPLYQKIVYLASTTAPTYSETFMRGTVVKMTIGSYINQQPGVITSVKYSLIGDMPWEIAMQGPSGGESDVQELPMGLQCTVSFRPIHNFAPQTGLYPYITSVDTKAKFFTETQHKDIR